MRNTEYQYLMSLSSADAEPIGNLLSAATKALGGRKDTTLASTIGVPATTIANWRRLNQIPDGYACWFRSTLIEKIGTSTKIRG